MNPRATREGGSRHGSPVCQYRRHDALRTHITLKHPALLSTEKHPIYTVDYSTLFNIPPYNITFGESLRDSSDPNIPLKCFIEANPPNTIAIYTDGSKIENSQAVGAAVFCPQLNISQKVSLDPKTAIFTAECCAINRALDITSACPDTIFFIFTDSQSVIRSLQKPTFRYSINNQLIEIKMKYATFVANNNNQKFIKFVWIPAHIGITGNE